MNTAMPRRQRGLGFLGFIIGAFVLVLVSITALKIIPAYMQNATIKKLFVAVANDPDIGKAAPNAIRLAYSKRASIENITAIKAEDIEIGSDQDVLVLSASYAVKVPLAGNISLYMEFNPSSAEK